MHTEPVTSKEEQFCKGPIVQIGLSLWMRMLVVFGFINLIAVHTKPFQTSDHVCLTLSHLALL